MYKPLAIVVSLLSVAAAAWGAERQRDRQVKQSQGFTTLSNGKDFTGWHGLKTMDPRAFGALDADRKAKVLEDGAADLKKHWRVEDGVIVNDGQGAYLTSDKD